MTQRELKEAALIANQAIVQHGLVILTWGNASVVDRNSGLVGSSPTTGAIGFLVRRITLSHAVYSFGSF